MRPFTYERAEDLAHASRLGSATGQGQTDATAQYLAGGTTLIDLMKLDVLKPSRVVDLGPIERGHSAIEIGPSGLKLGAFARMSTVAADAGVLREYPMIAQSLQLAASAQLRNMATLGGNVLQRTRCPYFRDPTWEACNKRNPGSGCTALSGLNRNHAVLGVDASCISQYPGDFAVGLIALGSEMEVFGAKGARRIPIAALHRPVDGKPHIEHTLQSGEIITAFHIPDGGWNRRSLYLKIRDRSSYEFAIASAAVALDLEDQNVRHVRIGIGGMSYRPWRSHEAERMLIGKPLTEANAESAAHAAFAGAVTHGYNDYKPDLGRRTLVRAMLQAAAMPLNGAET
jgi:xanthine dehydrogenase YagS FAD-binding subunit